MQALNKVFQQKERLFQATFIKKGGIIQKQDMKTVYFLKKRYYYKNTTHSNHIITMQA